VRAACRLRACFIGDLKVHQSLSFVGQGRP
jgi:hypothetical protein